MENHEHKKLIEAMSSPEFYPDKPDDVIHIQTHISDVFLAGDLVYKIKKPVDMGFLDFTTLEKRHKYCCREIELNRRLTSNIYLGVDSITDENGGYKIKGFGPVAEYAVRMRRLPDENTLASMLERNRVSQEFMDLLTRTLVEFYQNSASGKDIDHFGSFEVIRDNCQENFEQISLSGAGEMNKKKVQIIKTATMSFLEHHENLFRRRVENKHIRDCHGDLKAEHVYDYKGIQILDCIEFNERFRYQDTASDLAFLAMDMEFLGYRPAALYLLSTYVHKTKDPDLMGLIDFYKCYRAMVQVKVRCLQLKGMHPDDGQKARKMAALDRYVDLGYQYALKITRPVVWVICGMIASGKSTIAGRLSNLFSIPWIRSDEVRKSLFKEHFNDPKQDSDTGAFEKGMYSPGATSLVYGRLLLLAQARLKKGQSVILDATCRKRRNRKDIRRLASDSGASVIFIECRCPDSEIKKRLAEREHERSVSDARLEHFEDIKSGMDPFDEIPQNMHIQVQTDQPPDKIVETILAGEYELLARQIQKMQLPGMSME